MDCMRLMCSRAIRVWVCAYRVLWAAVDEVELGKDFEMRELRTILPPRSECVSGAGLCFADASDPTQSLPVVSTNTNHAFRHDIAEERGIGQDIQPQRNVSRMVRWPAYVRLQRQKKILNMRLKVPPAIAQFQHVADRNCTSAQLEDKVRPY